MSSITDRDPGSSRQIDLQLSETTFQAFEILYRLDETLILRCENNRANIVMSAARVSKRGDSSLCFETIPSFFKDTISTKP